MTQENLEAQLCVGCGLCCDGTIFTHAGIGDEETVATSVRIHLTSGPTGQEILPLGCSLLESRCCSVYDERPKICQTYSCRLLKATRNGTVEIDEAHRIVEETSALRDEAIAAVGLAVEGTAPRFFDQMAKALDEGARSANDPKDFRREHSRAYLSLAALRMAVEAHFQRYPKSMWGTSDSEMG